MGVPTSEVGYTPAMSRREDHEVHKDMWWHWIKKNIQYKKSITMINLQKAEQTGSSRGEGEGKGVPRNTKFGITSRHTGILALRNSVHLPYDQHA